MENVNCENCVYQTRCNRRYLGECDTGVAFPDEKKNERNKAICYALTAKRAIESIRMAEIDLTDKRKWVRKAFMCYKSNRSRLPALKELYERVELPGVGGGGASTTAPTGGNGVERSMVHYLAEREKYEKAIKECENKIKLVDMTLKHFEVEEQAKGKKHSKYIRCRFLQGMSYARAAVECDLRERTSDFVIEEIMTVAYAIAEIERFI